MNHQLNELAGITCEGDAVLILEGSNDVKGFYEGNPGIHVSENKTLTIKGESSLTAASNGYGAGIGGVSDAYCGYITIKHTVTKITATRGRYATYSVGPGVKGSCGTVTIGDDVAPRSEPTCIYPQHTLMNTTPRVNVGVCCVHVAYNMCHSPITTQIFIGGLHDEEVYFIVVDRVDVLRGRFCWLRGGGAAITTLLTPNRPKA